MNAMQSLLIIGIILLSSIPVKAANANFVPNVYSCQCGQESLMTVYVYGEAREFGSNEYHLRLVEDDSLFDGDDTLFSIDGEYINDVEGDDNIVFIITFILKCSKDCDTISGIGVKSLQIVINGGDREYPTEGDPSTPYWNKKKGEYYVAKGSDDGDGEEKILAMEIFLSNTNIEGSSSARCTTLMYQYPGRPLYEPINASIKNNKEKTLTIPIPGNDSFVINVTSSFPGIRLSDTRIVWGEIPINAITSYITYSDPYSPDITMTGTTREDNIKFDVPSNVRAGKYELDILIYYNYMSDIPGVGRVFGSIEIDPFLNLVVPASTVPLNHSPIPPGDGCTGEGCHSQIKGSSSNLYGFTMLGASLLIIGILVLMRKKR